MPGYYKNMEKRLTQITIALPFWLTRFNLYDYIESHPTTICVLGLAIGTVNASRYSEVNGIPVALIGVLGYAAILGIHWFERRNDFFRSNGSMILFGISLVGFFFTLWLVYLEIAILKALCPFCVTSQVAMTIIFILSIIRVVRQP
jgi:uncharacterized membrane protein